MRISDCRISFRIVLVTIFLWIGTASAQCSSSSPRVGFQADFVMVQHQLRGSFRIVNDCSFVVSYFPVLLSLSIIQFLMRPFTHTYTASIAHFIPLKLTSIN